jgi:hypothetical protein
VGLPAFLILLNVPRARHGYSAIMAEDRQALARLERRIADLRCCIEQVCNHHGWSGGMPEREKMLTLLKATLTALEVRKEALEGTNQ